MVLVKEALDGAIYLASSHELETSRNGAGISNCRFSNTMCLISALPIVPSTGDKRRQRKGAKQDLSTRRCVYFDKLRIFTSAWSSY
eukprot:6458795-Amphidinium_carterae.1